MRGRNADVRQPPRPNPGGRFHARASLVNPVRLSCHVKPEPAAQFHARASLVNPAYTSWLHTSHATPRLNGVSSPTRWTLIAPAFPLRRSGTRGDSRAASELVLELRCDPS